MYISIVLAQIFGIVFFVLGLSMLFNKKWTSVAVEELTKNQGSLWIGGLVALFMGAIIVALNNSWTSGLPLFVTIIGWLALLKGAVILIFPNFTVSYYGKMNKGNVFVWGGFVILIISLFLLYGAFL
jgi:hypothetical protein